MKVQELRIGNLVNFNGVNYKIELLDLDGYIGLSDIILFEHVHIDDLKPIELTEEWLIKFGFKKFVPDFINPSLLIRNTTEGFKIIRHGIMVNHLHQLQNLYFALTGKEL
jgi:hypothetical protein